MPKKVKLNLDDLNVKSFQTSIEHMETKGGIMPVLTISNCLSISLCGYTARVFCASGNGIKAC